ncbi:MAG: magnesium transporter [Actinomycetaceae bacterium]|nr:magnesium transporter [Actinomycetaceae bacterium]
MEDIATDYLDLIRNRKFAAVAEDLRGRPAPVVADIIESLPTEEAGLAFRLLDKTTSLEVFEEFDGGMQADLLSALGAESTADAFRSLDPEEQAWLLDEVPAKVAKQLVRYWKEDERAPIRELLGYPRESVGRRMAAQIIRTRPDEKIGALLHRISQLDADNDKIAEIPVLTADRKLIGTVALAKLLYADPQDTVSTVMDSHPDFFYTTDNVEMAARQALLSGDLVYPVVDREERLVGIWPLADAAWIDIYEAEEDHARAGASEPLTRPYLLTPVKEIAHSRIVWLLVLGISATLTVKVMGFFESTLDQNVALALFVPLLIGIGGNTGSQAATTVTRALAVGDIEGKDIGRVAFKEIRAGLLVGCLLAIIASLVAWPLYGSGIALVIGLTLVFNCPIAATVGGCIPLIARACKVDPAVFSTPFISTFCDASGLVVYFSIAITVLSL